MNFEAIILDFDGTIADTRKSIVKTVQETLKYLGVSLIKDEEVEKLIGLPLKTTFEEAAGFKGKYIDKAIEEYRSKYLKIALNSITLFPGVEKTLKTLYNSGFKIAIASNRGKKVLVKLLNFFGIASLFSFIAGEEDVRKKKPAPDVVNLILGKLNAPPDKTLVVGDTVYDIEMGKKAFTFTCAVTYGNSSIDRLKTASPDYIIDNFTQLLDITGQKG